MKEKILLKLTGITLLAVSITLIILFFLFNKSDYDLMVLASIVIILTIAVITFILGISFITAKVSKKTTTIEVVEDDRDDEVEEWLSII